MQLRTVWHIQGKGFIYLPSSPPSREPSGSSAGAWLLVKFLAGSNYENYYDHSVTCQHFAGPNHLHLDGERQLL